MADEEDQSRTRLRREPGAPSEAGRRRARQAAALRENLRRRKAQERRREEDPAPGTLADDGDTP
jgi:hypothetical protein